MCLSLGRVSHKSNLFLGWNFYGSNTQQVLLSPKFELQKRIFKKGGKIEKLSLLRLFSIRERLENFEGRLSINSVNGEETEVVMKMPLDEGTGVSKR